MQVVVKSAIQGDGSLSAQFKSFIKSRGTNKVADAAKSHHQGAAAFDSESVKKEVIKECLPPYWQQLKNSLGQVTDKPHWQVQVSRPKDGNCTEVELLNGKKRKFCFNADTRDARKMPAEGEYVRVPKGEIADDDLVRVNATPEIVTMSEKIEEKEFKDIDLQKLLDGACHLFRYQADGKETFCKVEAHNNHKIRGIIGFVCGHKSAKTALYNMGCSTYRRK